MSLKNIKKFSFDEYKLIIEHLLESRTLLDYAEVNLNSDNFLILRHDVEYSHDRSLKLARFENSLGIRSSYFFQLRNNSYNFLSYKNLKICEEILSLGHKIGLHVHTSEYEDIDIVKNIIDIDANIMSSILQIKIDRFSYHRPKKCILRHGDNFFGMYNAYNEMYFTLTDNHNNIRQDQPKYISDSNHTWKIMHPLDKGLERFKKIQLLTHPFSWTKNGYDNFDNFTLLLNEKKID